MTRLRRSSFPVLACSAAKERLIVREASSVPLTFTNTMTLQRDVGSGVAVDLLIPSDPTEARRIQDEIEQLLYARRLHEHDVFSIKLALEEALVNAIKHGNQMDRSKKVQIGYRLFVDRFEVVITDEGKGFDPEIYEVFEITRLDKFFNIQKEEQAALQAF